MNSVFIVILQIIAVTLVVSLGHEVYTEYTKYKKDIINKRISIGKKLFEQVNHIYYECPTCNVSNDYNLNNICDKDDSIRYLDSIGLIPELIKVSSNIYRVQFRNTVAKEYYCTYNDSKFYLAYINNNFYPIDYR